MKFDHLTYYINHKISPVSQNILNKKIHFQRRESLYNHLGIPKKTLSNLEILEVGPAEGHNAAYLASCNPIPIARRLKSNAARPGRLPTWPGQ